MTIGWEFGSTWVTPAEVHYVPITMVEAYRSEDNRLKASERLTGGLLTLVASGFFAWLAMPDGTLKSILLGALLVLVLLLIGAFLWFVSQWQQKEARWKELTTAKREKVYWTVAEGGLRTDSPEDEIATIEEDLDATRAGLVIHIARYGTQADFNDVTEILKSKAKDGRLELIVANDKLDGDPAYGQPKKLHVEYTYAGERHSVAVDENKTLSLPYRTLEGC